MTLKVCTGSSWDSDSRRAGEKAARQALDGLGHSGGSFGWLFASMYYDFPEVIAGMTEITGNIPIMGISTPAELNGAGRQSHSIQLGLIAAETSEVRTGWWPNFTQDGRACTRLLFDALVPQTGETLLLAGEGLGGDVHSFDQITHSAEYQVAGCLTDGDRKQGRTSQSSRQQVGSGGLAGLALSNELTVGIGVAHGWQATGALARIDRVQGPWVRLLDQRPPNEIYAHYFGFTPRDWVHPPLSEMVRLYPLGVAEKGRNCIHTPLRFEADGSLRMNTVLPEGSLADLMIGTQAGCNQAAQEASRQALHHLGGVSPRFALVFIDETWREPLALNPQAEIQAIHSILGKEVVLMGGYTLGQIFKPAGNPSIETFTQHIEVVLWGDLPQHDQGYHK